jgi:hypothetical protein
MRKIFLLLLFTCFAFYHAYSQHPSAFRYDFDKKKYKISSGERKAIKEHIQEWLALHDTISMKGKISEYLFTPDEQILADCDSIGERATYNKTSFNGFPPKDTGAFFGAVVMIKSTHFNVEKYIINLSYYYQVVKIWNPSRVLYSIKPAKPLGNIHTFK